MRDRFVAGAVAGFIGASVQLIYGCVVKALGFMEHSFHDFGKVFIMSAPTAGLLSELVGIFSQVSNGAMFGIVLAYIISLTSSKFYLIKGLIFGTILWHLFLGLGTMYKLPAMGAIEADSSLITLLGSLIYGIITAYILKLLDKKTNLL